MNPKTFVYLYDDGLQAKEIENEKKKTAWSTRNKKLLDWGHTLKKY